MRNSELFVGRVVDSRPKYLSARHREHLRVDENQLLEYPPGGVVLSTAPPKQKREALG